MLNPEDCAEKFLEHLLKNKRSFVINIYRNEDLKVSAKYVNNFVVENCLPNGLWRKASYTARFYKHLKSRLKQLGYEVRFIRKGRTGRLVITKRPAVTKTPLLRRRIKTLRRLRYVLNLGSRVDNSLV